MHRVAGGGDEEAAHAGANIEHALPAERAAFALDRADTRHLAVLLPQPVFAPAVEVLPPAHMLRPAVNQRRQHRLAGVRVGGVTHDRRDPGCVFAVCDCLQSRTALKMPHAPLSASYHSAPSGARGPGLPWTMLSAASWIASGSVGWAWIVSRDVGGGRAEVDAERQFRDQIAGARAEDMRAEQSCRPHR